MPSRKSGSSDAVAPDSARRSSLRRLSSIASFGTLFSRRRSNNASEHTPSSASTLSLTSSTISNPPIPNQRLSSSSHNLLQLEEAIPEIPPPPPTAQTGWPSRRSSYVCLPDDPIGGMPRSRTFSNLPLPTRAKRSTGLPPSQTHARLPPAHLHPTRLPSPPISNRKHSHARLMSAGTRVPVIRNRVKRSDTEPLLKPNPEPASSLPRSTAFKENISLSPIKPLPAMDMFNKRSSYGSSMTSSSYTPSHPSRTSGYSYPEDLYGSSPALSRYAQHPAIQMAREYKSSPAYRSAKDRQPTPGASSTQGFQRWNSQPALTNSTNLRNSRHGEIKQARLMSARQAPTPPPPMTPISANVLTPMRRGITVNSSQHILEECEETPKKSQTTAIQPSSPKRSLLTISTSEPSAYWSGRVCALADCYRNEELAAHLSRRTPPKSETDKMHSADTSLERLRRVFEYLQSMCVTPEARHSLNIFRIQFADGMKLPELRKGVVVLDADARPSVGENCISEDVRAAEEGVSGLSMSETRKISFMDRLLGRQKRRSLVLI